jgi:hypothetical protein
MMIENLMIGQTKAPIALKLQQKRDSSWWMVIPPPFRV